MQQAVYYLARNRLSGLYAIWQLLCASNHCCLHPDIRSMQANAGKGVIMKHTIHIYVGQDQPDPCFATIGEAIAYASRDYEPSPASYPAADEDAAPVVIHIAPGIYREKLVLERPYVTLRGSSADTTVLVCGDYARQVLEDGSSRGTFRTATLRIHTHDVTLEQLTVQNDAGCGRLVGQAIALYADGDRLHLDHCRLIGSQDTLFTAPLPLKEAQPGGFIGPGEHLPRTMGRQFYEHCYIQGDVDFIFGGAICYFEGCELFAAKPQHLPPESPEGTRIYGYLTAASTPQNQRYGYVFHNCQLRSDCPAGSVYLGRPWREYARTVYLECFMDAHIHPAGWEDWNKDHNHFYYGEYACYGPGSMAAGRADFSRQLTAQEAAGYDRKQVLAGWEP